MRHRERIYLSGRFSQQEQFKAYRERIEALGHEVVSSWLDQTAKEPTSMKAFQAIALRDLADVSNATLALIDFSLPPRGGRETEHGAFLALMTPVWIINNQNRGNVFSSIGRPFLTWDHALDALEHESNG